MCKYSGTYAILWEDSAYKEELYKKLEDAFKDGADCDIASHKTGQLYKKKLPNRDQVELLCSTPMFQDNPLLIGKSL
jgi:hypothetical protein